MCLHFSDSFFVVRKSLAIHYVWIIIFADASFNQIFSPIFASNFLHFLSIWVVFPVNFKSSNFTFCGGYSVEIELAPTLRISPVRRCILFVRRTLSDGNALSPNELAEIFCGTTPKFCPKSIIKITSGPLISSILFAYIFMLGVVLMVMKLNYNLCISGNEAFFPLCGLNVGKEEKTEARHWKERMDGWMNSTILNLDGCFFFWNKIDVIRLANV